MALCHLPLRELSLDVDIYSLEKDTNLFDRRVVVRLVEGEARRRQLTFKFRHQIFRPQGALL